MLKQGLNAKDKLTLIALLKKGTAMTKASEWMQVSKKYVKDVRDEMNGDVPDPDPALAGSEIPDQDVVIDGTGENVLGKDPDLEFPDDMEVPLAQNPEDVFEPKDQPVDEYPADDDPVGSSVPSMGE